MIETIIISIVIIFCSIAIVSAIKKARLPQFDLQECSKLVFKDIQTSMVWELKQIAEKTEKTLSIVSDVMNAAIIEAIKKMDGKSITITEHHEHIHKPFQLTSDSRSSDKLALMREIVDKLDRDKIKKIDISWETLGTDEEIMVPILRVEMNDNTVREIKGN